MRPIDEKIVAMRLDNTNFEDNARQSLATMDRINASFDTDGIVKGIGGVDSSIGTLQKTVAGLSNKFSALKVMGTAVLSQLAIRAANAAIDMGKQFSIAPIMQGFSEYETKMGSIQTILANTKQAGTTLSQVTSTLDELNDYADKTIYNFAEMTRNIGTFTAAGVDLDTATNSIKGIANLAALSGSTSTQASTAMYQLSQAIASGTVKLQDWNSVVNAGMGGTTFQEALKRTARAHGIAVDEMIEKHGSFRESLQEGWITADVLTDTLEQLTMSTEGVTQATIDGYKAQLKNKGYNDQQIEDILSLANAAEESATKIRTITQLFDTMKESVGSKWSEFWEIVIGDFDEATERLTKIADAFDRTISKTFDGFLKNLKKFKDLDGISNIWKGFGNILKNVGDIIKAVTDGFKKFFPEIKVEKLANLAKGFADLTEKIKLPKPALEAITKAIGSFGDIVKEVFGSAKDVVKEFANSIGDALKKIDFTDIKDKIKSLANEVANFVKGSSSFSNVFDKVKDLLSSLGGAVKDFLSNFKLIPTAFSDSGDKIKEFSGIWDKLVEKLKDNKLFETIINGVKSVIKIFEKLFDKLKEVFLSHASADSEAGKGKLDGLRQEAEETKSVFESIKEAVQEAADVMGSIFSNDAFFNITKLALMVASYKQVANVLKALTGTVKAFKESFDLLGEFKNIFSSISSGISTVAKALGTSLKAESLKSLSLALLGFAGALWVLSKIDGDRVYESLVQAAAAIGIMVAAVKLLDKINIGFKDAGALTVGLVGMAAGIASLGKAFEVLSKVDIQNVLPSLAAIGALFAGLRLLKSTLTADMAKNIASLSLMLISLAGAMKVIASAAEKFEGISWSGIGKTMTSMVGVVGSLSVFARFTQGSNLKGAASSIIAVASALTLLIVPMKVFSKMDWNALLKGAGTITALTAVLGAFNVAMGMIHGSVQGAGTVLALATALTVLVIPIKAFGSMNLGEIAKGILGLAGSMGVLVGGIAGLAIVSNVLSPLSLGISSFGKAMLAVTGSMALFSASVLGLTVALGIIGTFGPAAADSLVQGLVIIAESLEKAAPVIADSLIKMLIESFRSIEQNIDELIDILASLLVKVINGVANHAEEIMQACINLVEALANALSMAFQQLDVDQILKAITAMGAILAIAKLGEQLNVSIGPALIAIGKAGVLIVALEGVLAAIGALNSIPGVQEFIDGGGDALQSIGQAIGKFVGGIVGGAMEGATSTLPQVATNLSEFARNVEPFMTLVQTIPADIGDKIGNLTRAVIGLSGASFLNTITSIVNIFSGGNSAELFAQNVKGIAIAIKSFSDEIAGINIETVNTGVQAATALSNLQNSLPKLGGIIQFFTGTQDLSVFSNGIVELGRAIKSFSNEVVDINIEAINTGVSAAQSLVALQDSLPKLNGLIQFITGQGDLATFGMNLVIFGKGLKSFSDATVGINVEAMNNAVEAGRKLSELQATLENSGGIISWFTGDNDLATFGSNIKKFFSAITSASIIAADMDVASMDSAISAAKRLSELNNLVFTGLGDSAPSIKAFGKAMNSLGNDIEGFPAADCYSAGNAVQSLTTKISGLAKVDTGAINNLANAVKEVGTKAVDKFNSAFNTGVSKSITVVKSYLDKIANTIRNTGGNQLNTAGRYAVDRLIAGIRSKSGAVSNAARSLTNAIRSATSNINLYGFGANAGSSLASGLSSRYYQVYNAAASLAIAASNAVRSNLRIHSPSKVFYGLGDFVVQGFVNALSAGEDNVFKTASGLAQNAIDAFSNLNDEFSNLLDDELELNPQIVPVVDWSNLGTQPNLSATLPISQNGVNLVGNADLRLANNVQPLYGSQTSYNPLGNTTNYTINNERMLEGAIFQVREENDIREIAREINRLENEEMYRKGVVL